MLSPRSMCGARSTNVNITEHVLIQLPTLETMGKDFYVFFNGDTEEMNVVYKKRDGNYAHIEPRVEK